MISFSYFEIFLMLLIIGVFIYVIISNRKIIYLKDKNFYASLRKEIMDSISEDERQQIYRDEYQHILKDIKDELNITVTNNDDVPIDLSDSETDEINSLDAFLETNSIADKTDDPNVSDDSENITTENNEVDDPVDNQMNDEFNNDPNDEYIPDDDYDVEVHNELAYKNVQEER